MPAADGFVTIVRRDGSSRQVALDDHLDARGIEASERDANAWIKRLRHARMDGVPLRDRFTYRGDSLWWFVELYLHKQHTVAAAYRTIRAVENVIAREKPARLRANGGPLERLLVTEVAKRHGVSECDARATWPAFDSRVRILAQGRFHTMAAVADRLRPSGHQSVPGRADVVAFVHTAFWRKDRDEESYVGPVLHALRQRLPGGRVALVGLGPRTNFRARGWRHRFAEFNDPAARDLPVLPIESLAGWRAIRPSMSVWRDRRAAFRALTSSDEVRQAAVIEGCDLWPAIRNDLLGVSHLQLPWSARSMDEAGAALDGLEPRVAVTYAEAGGWGRALALEARRRGIPLVGLQHGFIYRHWLNYLHEPDEMAPSAGNPSDVGFPRPDLTLVYDGFAEQHLTEAGHLPPSSIAVTGSPRLEAFAEAGGRLTADARERIRSEAGAAPGQKLVVLATKYSQVKGSLAPLVEAIASMTDAHLAVKCHPAETPEPYEAAAGTTPNVRVMPASTDLGALVASADLIVTVNSTAALEAMAVGVPGLVLALPSNLTPFVEAGALAGVERPGEIATALRRLLYDEVERHNLRERCERFSDRYGMVSGGGAADRAADAILRIAGLQVG